MTVAAALLVLLALPAAARIDGVSGTSFTLTARAGFISIPDGPQPFMWGYALNDAAMQYPGPTLIVNQGAAITVTLRNALPTSTSIIFPGQLGVVSKSLLAPTAQGPLALEAGPGAVVQYRFPALQPGTYIYHSGTRPGLQVEMGLAGALIIRPASAGKTIPGRAYQSADTAYDHETLFLLTELDPDLHLLVRQGKWDRIDTTVISPQTWFINGRCAPDTLADAFVPWLPAQPYNCAPAMEPGQRLLLRLASPGRDPHPFQVAGNHARLIARDGRLLSSGPAAGADLAQDLFTIPTVPGGTADAIFTWTGQGLDWDVFGHKPSDPRLPFELAADHGKPFPVLLPNPADQAFGDFYSGSPYLGMRGALPSGVAGLVPDGAFAFLWHAPHGQTPTTGRPLPAGMATMLIVHPPGSLPPTAMSGKATAR